MVARVKRNELGRRIGESHPRAVLTDAQVTQIRDDHELRGWNEHRIAIERGVSRWTAHAIIYYKRRAQVAREREQ